MVNEKGCICNWWGGVESVADMLSKLEGDAMFYGYPYHDGIGYMFRKGVERLIFVFSNEFDNSITTKYTKTEGLTHKNVLVIPHGDSKKITFNFLNKFKSSLSPIDQFCIRTLSEDAGNIDEYVRKIGLEDNVDT